MTYYLLENKISPKDGYKIQQALNHIKIDIKKDTITLNSDDITEKLRNDDVNKQVALFAQRSDVRDFIRRIQKKVAENEYFIVDGRDIGTVVFKDAFCKFYLDASPAIRAQRRLHDAKENSEGKSVSDIEKEIMERDETDKTRADSPLKIPVDALVIDSSSLTIDEVMEEMVKYYNKCLSEISHNNLGADADVKESKIFLNALEHFETKQFVPQTLVKGIINNIKEKEIIIDIGSKRDAIIAGEEIAKLDLNSLKKGQEIDVYILKANPSSPQIFVSKLEADKRSGLIKLKEAFEKDVWVEGEVHKPVRGGFVVDVWGNQAFCPSSEYDVKKVNKEVQRGKKEKFYIIELDGHKIIVSRKRYLEETYQKIREEFFATIKEGDILNGTVVHIAKFGVFVEIKEGVTAIIRPKNISWRRYNHISEIISKGEQVTVKVLSIRNDQNKLEVSKKDAEADPFISFQNFHNVDDEIKGTVKSLEPFGAFVEVAKGVEGLLHVAELSWTKRIDHPNQLLKVGDVIATKILGMDSRKRKLSLGLKQMIDNPWDTIEQRYPPGELIRAEIKDITKKGIHCKIDKEFDGFIYIADISWGTDKIKLKDEFKKGEFQQVKVIGYEKGKKRIKLGVKQKSSNPWEDLRNNYGLGGAIFAEVTRFAPSGAFVKVNDELEGFCHLSQASKEKIEKIEEALEIGKSYYFAIQVIDEENKKIALSIKEYLRNEDKKNIEKYLGNGETKNTISLGDLVGN